LIPVGYLAREKIGAWLRRVFMGRQEALTF
jgi:hypothetical protein